MKIDKDVPFPSLRQEYSHYPFKDMLVGDSFYVHDPDGVITHRLQTQVSYQKKLGDKRFTSRRIGGGLRVWRTT